MFKELKRIAYQVDDVEKARQWYGAVLGLEPAFDSPLAAIFKIADNTLSLAKAVGPAPEHDGRISAYWEVEDVDRSFARLLELGARPKAGPSDVLTLRTAQVVDPFGNVIGLCGPLGQGRQLAIESQASQTAHAVALCRALMAHEERAEIRRPDPFSELFLAAEIRPVLQDAEKRRLVIDTKLSRPLYGYFVARSAFMDGVFVRALRARVAQIVFLGAGYDTRALRFQDQLSETQIFELDAPSTQGRKVEVLRSSRTPVPPQVHFVSINFKTDDLFERLRSCGYDSSLPTLFLWEGVTYYLAQDIVDRTLGLIGDRCGAGSSIAFDYMTRKLDSINAGEPFLSWMDPAGVQGHLQRLGLRLVEHLDGTEMVKRYLTLADGTLAEKPLSAIRLAYAECA